jgi:hypothetical protein
VAGALTGGHGYVGSGMGAVHCDVHDRKDVGSAHVGTLCRGPTLVRLPVAGVRVTLDA